ncbi:MAG: hypothetical protein IKG72_10490, partial [Bacillus sp. (in: Bacteria)]|nr:hypothetical protein [Bacillus sp. (in: firmicutes)]
DFNELVDRLKMFGGLNDNIREDTTKEKGTGLGLMMTIKIIESHGGTIRFESKSFEGTRVIITFPSN